MNRLNDVFELRILFRRDPIANGALVRKLVETLLAAGGELAPTLYIGRQDQREPLDVERLVRLFEQRDPPDRVWLGRGDDLRIDFTGYDGRDPGGMLVLRVPLAAVAGCGDVVVALAEALARAFPPIYGWGHRPSDISHVTDPHIRDAWAPKQVYQAYWLTILGAPIVKQLGKAHVQATPAHRVVMLPDGGALIATTADPADSSSPAAREAQARALAHLRPDVDEATALRELLARAPSAAPPPTTFAPPSEQRPDPLPSDVADVEATISAYVDHAESYIAGNHTEIDGLDGQAPEVLLRIDEHFLARDYWAQHDVASLERVLVPGLGAYLGRILVHELGGRWVPRQRLDEAQVVIGGRAWLPFARVRHFVQSREAARAHALATFFAAAKRG